MTTVHSCKIYMQPFFVIINSLYNPACMCICAINVRAHDVPKTYTLQLNGVVFLDIRKALDSINHNILAKKLETQFLISNNELKWFRSYLRIEKSLFHKWTSILSSTKLLAAFRRGPFLGPLLFLLYIIDFPENLEETTVV